MPDRSLSAVSRLHDALVATIGNGILVRAGELVTPELAAERANNLSQQVIEVFHWWMDDATEPLRSKEVDRG